MLPCSVLQLISARKHSSRSTLCGAQFTEHPGISVSIMSSESEDFEEVQVHFSTKEWSEMDSYEKRSFKNNLRNYNAMLAAGKWKSGTKVPHITFALTVFKFMFCSTSLLGM